MVVLAASGTAAAIKMSQQDAQRIEQHTGMPPQDLTDEDLNEAMTDLGIQGQPVTAEDQAAIGGQSPTPTSQEVPVSSAPPAAEAGASIADEIERLADLKDRGIITEEDFEAAKKKLLGI